MKKLQTIILLAGAAAVLASCHGEGHGHSHAEAAEAAEQHHHEGENLVELSAEQAERFGVAVDTVRPGDFAMAIRCSGVISRNSADAATATAPAAGVVRLAPGISEGATVGRGATIATIDASAVTGGSADRAAKAALDAARREVQRLEPLYADKLVTATEYNAAIAALKAAEAAYSPMAAGGRVVAPRGGVVTQLQVADGAYVGAGDAVAAIASDNHLTLRADVAASDYPRLASVTDARIGDFTLSDHHGRKGGVSAANGYGTIWFTFVNDGTVMPGGGADIYLLGAPKAGVISVPKEAVTEQQGQYFVYLAHSPGHYVKRPVTLGASDGLRYEITSGLSGGEPVVTAGAMTVRLAESSGAIPEGHSHNH